VTRGDVLLVTAGWCLLLIWVVRHWWRLLSEQRDLVNRTRPPQVLPTPRRLRRSLDRQVRRTWPGGRLGDRLDRAALPLTVLEAVGIGTVATLLCTLLVSLLYNRTFVVVALIATPFAMNAVLNGFIRRRAAALVDQLPELAGALAGAASAGRSLRAALRHAAKDLADPAASEMRRTLESLAAGYSMEDALRETARRLPSRELDLLVTTLVVQARGGGDLARALRRLTEALEVRRDARHEIRFATSRSTAAAYLTVGFGLGIVALLQRLYPGALDRTTGSEIGVTAVFVSCVLYAVGILLIRRTVRVRGDQA
jgi:tight adherence protein B